MAGHTGDQEVSLSCDELREDDRLREDADPGAVDAARAQERTRERTVWEKCGKI